MPFLEKSLALNPFFPENLQVSETLNIERDERDRDKISRDFPVPCPSLDIDLMWYVITDKESLIRRFYIKFGLKTAILTSYKR